MTRIEYVSGIAEYDEFRSPGWYVINEDGNSQGPFISRREAEYAAGRPEDE